MAQVFVGITGFNPLALLGSVRGAAFYVRDWMCIRRQKARDGSAAFPIKACFPILGDRFTAAGTMRGHYFYQDLHVAGKIFAARPVRHVDIGSRTDGFVAHVAVFREIEVFDIRDVTSHVPNIRFKKADLMQLPEGLEGYCDSVSALHSIEHFGLGRYGDPVDYNGHVKAIRNITRMLLPGGRFYFSVPVGKQRIEFNAHRVFSLAYLWELLGDDYELLSFSYVDDAGDFHADCPFSEQAIADNFGCWYGCGIFELRKKRTANC
jgi:SAM-dependent methyltransferase